jgi:transcriptional regulator with XRE-family HTH domain
MPSATRIALRNEIGARLRHLREASGITSQEKLAELAGVHRTYIGRLERAESGVTLEALSAILAAMGVSLAEFFRPFTSPVRTRTPRKRS